ncbi:valine--tRNA ligase [Desulfobotulus sp.]|jgi:valyl-tRNA synthetase|uniref:valine--tRNA ligase n=1 Tax=Desulfobotulus sp. TaxID=1940337 RepID=UPI002A36A3E7|nr:valine--tRNA ligase [Desulfobotulus sp.]MDY0162235.1 valine--tRNA ligase [Desulfobotulus sp.]
MSEALLDKGYEPHEVEARWYRYWLENKLFAAKDRDGEREAFSIVIPPPNVTGKLHMGHALNNTLQDILCRYQRLCGKNVLWMPGTDHAGIATQNVVEKQLASEGKSRDDLGRDAFIDRVWEWRKEYGGAIIHQLQRLGASCDWDRERFTMDEGLSRAVRKVFVRLYEEGLIYKGHYLINWCPRCHTALADLEVEHEEKASFLYHIAYPLTDGSGSLVVATTRPETLFGDTAVALHPEDERYADLSCASVKLPLTDREIPVIRDSYVDREFGTGCLKVTPAHDPNDFELGIKHGLEQIKAIDDDGRMNAHAGPFAGLDRFVARERAVAELEKQGLLVKKEDLTHSVGHCYRCKTVVEPNLSLQWFVKVGPLADKALKAVEEGKTRIYPENWTKTYYEWMRNIRDWCISRQIWWGHRIPAWTCEDCGRLLVLEADPETCPDCGGTALTQESDVLDTWFSSALWPFSTMGWPEKTDLLKTFYPTSVLVTGFDILFFWVARMMMMGTHFMDEVPFKDVYIHALVRDAEGKKMSKSLGNVIDPLEVIEKYGTDAFRFTLTSFAAMGRDIKLSEERVEGYRHFINKLWNAARFSLMHLDQAYDSFDPKAISLPDQWILSRLHSVGAQAQQALDTYRFNDAASILYRFVWNEFCDWYLEAIKPILFGKSGDAAMRATKGVLYRVISDTLILLHPIVPFVTEEIWEKLPGGRGSIMEADFPTLNWDNQRLAYSPEAEVSMEFVIELVTGVRNIRGEMNLSPAQALNALFHTDNPFQKEMLTQHQDLMKLLARLDTLDVMPVGERPRASATSIVSGSALYVLLEGVLDFAKEVERLDKAMAKVDKELGGIAAKLENSGFVDKAPEPVVKKVKAQYEELVEKRAQLLANRDRIAGMV